MVQALVLGALVFLALSLAGAPFTSGAVAKYALKPVFGALDWVWIGFVVGISTFGTTLLMVRFVWVSYRTEPHPEPGYRWPGVAWGALIALVLLLPFVFGKPSAWLTNLVEVPLALNLGLLALLFTVLRPRLLAPLVNRIPPGDILALFAPVQTRAIDWYQRADQRWQSAPAPAWNSALSTSSSSSSAHRAATPNAVCGNGRSPAASGSASAPCCCCSCSRGCRRRPRPAMRPAARHNGPRSEPVAARGGDKQCSRRCRLESGRNRAASI
jgi:hypothetical protein